MTDPVWKEDVWGHLTTDIVHFLPKGSRPSGPQLGRFLFLPAVNFWSDSPVHYHTSCADGRCLVPNMFLTGYSIVCNKEQCLATVGGSSVEASQSLPQQRTMPEFADVVNSMRPCFVLIITVSPFIRLRSREGSDCQRSPPQLALFLLSSVRSFLVPGKKKRKEKGRGRRRGKGERGRKMIKRTQEQSETPQQWQAGAASKGESGDQPIHRRHFENDVALGVDPLCPCALEKPAAADIEE